jgi:hypothetical protein
MDTYSPMHPADPVNLDADKAVKPIDVVNMASNTAIKSAEAVKAGAETVVKQFEAVKDAVVERATHTSTTEKMVGAAVIGVAIGAAATAIGSALLKGDTKPARTAAKKAPAKTAA